MFICFNVVQIVHILMFQYNKKKFIFDWKVSSNNYWKYYCNYVLLPICGCLILYVVSTIDLKLTLIHIYITYNDFIQPTVKKTVL